MAKKKTPSKLWKEGSLFDRAIDVVFGEQQSNSHSGSYHSTESYGAATKKIAGSADAPRALNRIMIAFLVFAVIFFGRLVFLQVIVSDHYTAMARETRMVSFETTPKRGTIYDRNGVILATSVDCLTVYCNPVEVTDAPSEARAIARVLGGKAADYLPALEKESTTFAYVKRQADMEAAETLRSMGLDGVYFINDSRREYPNGGVGGQVIGVCDVDGNGITGLELQYEDILAGTPGKYSAERGEKGAPIPGGVHEDVPAQDGEDIMITLDIKLQAKMEEALEEGIITYESKKGNACVIDGDNGEILAICSYPYLDPTDRENSVIGSENLTAITQPFEPGSIFKTVSALTVLEQHAMEPDTEIFVPAVLEANDYEITDSHFRFDEDMTLSTILNQSSNVGISLSTEKAGFEHLYDNIVDFGLVETTGVDYPGESAGKLPDFEDWGKIIAYNISFGQGLTTTPLHMASFYGMIAADGLKTQPHFLMSKPQTNETVTYETEQLITDQESIDKLKDMLCGVVQQGTGTDAAIDGYDIAGKTSTAEIAENGTYADDRYNLCFAGFINNSSSNIACFVSVNDVQYEGRVASVFHDIMAEAIDLYNIVPTQ